MTIAVGLVLLILTILAAAVKGVAVPAPLFSAYELKRRASQGDEQAKTQLHNEKFYGNLQALLTLLVLLLVALIVAVAVLGLGPVVGLLVVLGSIVVLGPLARWQVITAPAQRIFNTYMGTLIRLVAKYAVLRLLLKAARTTTSNVYVPHSREELLHIIDKTTVLSKHESRLLVHAAAFETKLVGDVMVPAKKIVSVNKKELLGPLVINDLHKTGYKRFPVIDGSLATIVGILRLKDMLIVDATRHTVTAEKAMDPRVVYVRQDDSLQKALGAFLHNHHHMAVVVDEAGKTVGLVTIEDVIAVLFGRQLSE